MLLSTAAVYAEVTRKAISNPDGTTKYIFYSEGEEIARQVLDEDGGIRCLNTYENGQLIRRKTFDKSGKLESDKSSPIEKKDKK